MSGLRKTIHIICFLLSVDFLTGQDVLAKLDTAYLDLEVIGVDQGVSAGLVYNVAQDAKGFMWMATSQGLNRYDGYQIKEFKHVAGDPYSLPGNDINFVFIDSRGILWLNIINHGVHVLDFKSEKFYKVKIPFFTLFTEDAFGNIWINDPSGGWNIIEIHQNWSEANEKTPITNYFKISSCQQVFNGIPQTSFVNYLLLTEDGELWLENKNFIQVFTLDYKNRKAIPKFNIPFREEKIIEDQNLLLHDKEKQRVYLFANRALKIIDQHSGNIIKSILYPKGVRKFIFTQPILDDAGKIIACGFFNSVFLIDPDKAQFTFLLKSGLESYLPDWRLLSIHPFIDRNKNLWLPSAGYGVYKFNRNAQRFKYFGVNHVGPSIPKTSSLTRDKILFNDYAGPKIFSVSQKKFIEFWNDLLPDKLKGKDVYPYIAVSPDKYLWARFSYKNQFWIYKCDTLGRFVKAYPWKFAFNDENNGIFFFSDKNTIWSVLAAIDNSYLDCLPDLILTKWNIETGKTEHFVYKNKRHDFVFGELRSHLITADGKLWLGMSNGGLLVFDPVANQWEHFYKNEKKPNSISNNRILCIQKDPLAPDSIVWIGTSDGLNKFDVHKKIFSVIKEKNGLPNNVIYAMLPDNQNNFWISTNKGLSQYFLQGKKFRNFTVEDGLQHNEFNKGAYLKNDENTLFFGGVGGLTWFNPDEFYSEQSPPSKTVITGLRINNKVIDYTRTINEKEGKFFLNKPIEYVDEITLTHDINMITFEFAALDLTKPKKNKYKYKLAGFNDDWIDAGYQNEATYTNLPYGQFVFNVIGSNSENTWDEKGASIIVNVIPPWWLTWWFKSISFIFVCLLGYAYFHIKFKEKERLNELRNRISTNLHDEIGSTLSSISLFGTVAQKNIEREDSVPFRMLEKINESSTQVMESMNDIVWAINAENDKMLNVYQRMRTYLSDFESVSSINFETDFDSSVANTNLAMIQRRNIYLIFKEAVNNAVKYAKASKIVVTIQVVGKNIELMISDNGVGFDHDEINKKNTLSGNGLKNIQVRAKELKAVLTITSNPGQGTLIKLSFNPKTNQ